MFFKTTHLMRIYITQMFSHSHKKNIPMLHHSLMLIIEFTLLSFSLLNKADAYDASKQKESFSKIIKKKVVKSTCPA